MSKPSAKDIFKEYNPQYGESPDDFENVILTKEQVLELSTARNKDHPNYADRQYPVKYKNGHGPYPVIDKSPDFMKVVYNINRQDLAWGSIFPILAGLHGYMTYRTFRSPNFVMALIGGITAAIPNCLVRPYCLLIHLSFIIGFIFFIDRLVGYTRNDDEATKYLGWKQPIYYDSDLLLGVPLDIDRATIITQHPDNVLSH